MTRRLLPLALVATLGLAACTGDDDLTDGTDGTDDTEDSDVSEADLTNGGDVFAGTCANCHGVNGNDGSAPNLYERVPEKDAASLETLITTGQGYMPAQEVSGDDLRDVIAYVLDTFGE